MESTVEETVTEDDEESEEPEIGVRVLMEEDFKLKINILTKAYETEIGGWITGSIKEHTVILEDLLVPTQEVSSSNVEISSEDCVKLRKEFGKKCAKIIGHWHSHGQIGNPFWSQEDEENMNKIISPRDFFVFVVTSGDECLVRVELNKPFRLSIDKVKYGIIKPGYKEFKEKLLKSVKKKVKEKHYEQVSYGNNRNYNKGQGYYERGFNQTNEGWGPPYIDYNKNKKVIIVRDISVMMADELQQRFGKDFTTFTNIRGEELIFVIRVPKKIPQKSIDKIVGEIDEVVETMSEEPEVNSNLGRLDYGD